MRRAAAEASKAGRWRGGVGRVVEQVAEELHAGEAVGDCMMNPDEHADLVAGQSGQQPQLPQRARPVQRALPQLLARLQQLTLAGPSRKRARSDVVGDVEGWSVHPDRPA